MLKSPKHSLDHLRYQLIQEKFKAFVAQNGNETIVVPNQKFNQSEWYHFLKNFGFNRSQVSSICTENHSSGKIFFSDSSRIKRISAINSTVKNLAFARKGLKNWIKEHK